MSDLSLETLSKQFSDLQTSSAAKFDPVRFAFIAGLMRRLEDPVRAGNSALLSKMNDHLRQYQEDYFAQCKVAEAAINKIESDHVEHLEHAQKLFSDGEFKQLEKLHIALRDDVDSKATLAPLSELNREFQQTVEHQAQQQELSFDEVLFAQEQQARSSAGDALPAKQDGSGEQLELQSMKNFRASMKHFDVDKMITRALTECPENPGPHNPQMLAVKSLMHMRELSPHYLRRFAGYIETMLWLEKNTAKLSNKMLKKF